MVILPFVWRDYGVCALNIGPLTLNFADFPWISGGFLRDETGSGRGVHRFWHFLIQKPRSNFSSFYDFSHFSGIFGVGVV